MPNIQTASTSSKAEKRANHSHTISDAKRGVTYAGQEQLKPLPIPELEETCQRYLESVQPFLVCIP
jgi:carnitine O-acetyltransferase